jgi:hypothetical protein
MSRADIARLQEALDGMLSARARLDSALERAWPPEVVELYVSTRATVRRLQRELALDERLRRQLRLLPPRRVHTRGAVRHRPAADPQDLTDPDAETQVIPTVPDETPDDADGTR